MVDWLTGRDYGEVPEPGTGEFFVLFQGWPDPPPVFEALDDGDVVAISDRRPERRRVVCSAVAREVLRIRYGNKSTARRKLVAHYEPWGFTLRGFAPSRYLRDAPNRGVMLAFLLENPEWLDLPLDGELEGDADFLPREALPPDLVARLP